MTTLETGDSAPPFALSDQHGNTVRLEDFHGRKLLIYFYPEADTPGCTKQSCDVRDHREDLTGIGLDVVGVSPDAPEKQLAFDEKYELGFPLLADLGHGMADAYGVWQDDTQSVRRSSFLVGGDGRIERAWYGVKPMETVPKAVAAL
jgi:peroxiredoxin Q/BCP